jgi:hypothetical protein
MSFEKLMLSHDGLDRAIARLLQRRVGLFVKSNMSQVFKA